MAKEYDYVSDCCLSKVRVDKHDEEVFYCRECGEVCDVLTLDCLDNMDK